MNLPPGNYELNCFENTSTNSDGRYKLVINNANIDDPVAEHIWTGSLNNNWFSNCNWSSGHVPDKNNNVTIPLTSSNPRIYSSGNATPDNANGHPAGKAHCNSVDIESGAIITIESNPVGTAELRVNHP